MLQGYKNEGGNRLSLQLRGSARLREARDHRGLHAERQVCPPTSADTWTSPAATWAGRPRCRGTGRISTTCSGRPSAAARATRPKLGYDWLLIYDEPRKLDLIFDVAYYDQIDTLPNAQNVDYDLHPAGYRRGRAPLHRRAALARRGRRRERHRLGAGLPGQPGYAASLLRRFVATFDLGLAAPASRTRRFGCAPRPAPPTATTTRLSPNFYFGGFGNNYVDDGPIKRYREYYSLPGFGINAVSALKFVKEMVEWDLPPYVFEDVGHAGVLPDLAPAFGLRRRPVDGAGKRRAAHRITRARARRPTCASPSCTGTT